MELNALSPKYTEIVTEMRDREAHRSVTQFVRDPDSGWRAIALRGSRPRFGGLDLAIAGRRVGHQRAQQLARRLGHVLDGMLEGRLVDFRGPGEAAQLAHELRRYFCGSRPTRNPGKRSTAICACAKRAISRWRVSDLILRLRRFAAALRTRGAFHSIQCQRSPTLILSEGRSPKSKDRADARIR